MNKEKICQNCKYHYIEEISFDYPQSCCAKEKIHHTTEKWCTCDKFKGNKEYFNNLEKHIIKLELERDKQKKVINKIKPMLKELNIKIKDILNIGIDIKEISDILELLEEIK